MKLKDLIAIVDEVYPDGLVWMYYKSPGRNHGDTLAKFIAAELKEAYDVNASSKQQLREAVRVLETARRELLSVTATLENMAYEMSKGDH